MRNLENAAAMFRTLGYTQSPRQIDAAELGIRGADRNVVIRQGRRSREGYAVFIAELERLPRSLTTIGRSLREGLHDHPLAVLGVPGQDGAWERVVLLRPRVVEANGRLTYRTVKLEVLVGSPTHHDADVFDRLRWRQGLSDADAQDQVDSAFDVEAVTSQFFEGLRAHFDRMEDALGTLSQLQPHIMAALDEAGGLHRVAIRIVAQLLFTWFLQRKGSLGGDRDYLLTRWRRRRGLYYATELEPLFYDAFALPAQERLAGLHGQDIPFLNGGLFHRNYGRVSLPLPDDLFHENGGLLGYLSRWTFTLSEESPDEVDVAVDPELLGRIFEHLISDEEQSRHGVVYTPRPVVQFMCKEALVQHLQKDANLDETWCRRLVTDDHAMEAYAQEMGTRPALDLSGEIAHSVESVHILDPAVGSGAFLLGMLAELVRLRQIAYRFVHGEEPTVGELREWKLSAIEKNLFGVDIEPLALELCRLRLWLTLVVETGEGTDVLPLPNLEHRTVAADSLTDFVGGIEVQNTRNGSVISQPFENSLGKVEQLRHAYFRASEPSEKEYIRAELAGEEDHVIERVLDQALTAHARGEMGKGSQEAYLGTLLKKFRSHDRVYPIFVPEFHAPEVWDAGGFDIVIMNPPYLGKKQVAQKVREGKIEAGRHRDWQLHYRESTDLMILFAYRARQLVRRGGVCSVIFNDSLFTSSDAETLRRTLLDEDTICVMARTRCFEGQAVNGGVVVWRREGAAEGDTITRWVEGYKRDPRDFAAASDPAERDGHQPYRAGKMEVWLAPRSGYEVIPSRPLFRPDPVALDVVNRFQRLEPSQVRTQDEWAMLSNTRKLNQRVKTLEAQGWFDRLASGTFVPLGYCIVGGQGIATADDLFFLAAVEGTEEAEACLVAQARVEEAVLGYPLATRVYQDLLRRGLARGEALVHLHEDDRFESDRFLSWPRLLRVAPNELVRLGPLTDEERRNGIRQGPYYVRFEKGDQSAEDDSGRAIGAAWWRVNPIVIDWSYDAVQLLRRRARQAEQHRKPYFRNEELWGRGGVTWNRIARYLHVRFVPEGAIFNDKAPTITSSVPWIDAYGLLSLLNSDVVEFIVRTYLGSLMQLEIGDIRRVPVPVLNQKESRHLSHLGQQAVTAVKTGDREEQRRLEREVNAFVRGLYGVSAEAGLWVVR